jgi:hypothetical protein
MEADRIRELEHMLMEREKEILLLKRKASGQPVREGESALLKLVMSDDTIALRVNSESVSVDQAEEMVSKNKFGA